MAIGQPRLPPAQSEWSAFTPTAKRRVCMNSSASESKPARYLLAAYCVFIIYGCFIPFHFNFDPNFVRWTSRDLPCPTSSAIFFCLSPSVSCRSGPAQPVVQIEQDFFRFYVRPYMGFYLRPLSSPAKLLRPAGIRQSGMPCAMEWVLSSVPLGVVF